MIVRQLEKVWQKAPAWPGYTQALQALVSLYSPKSAEGNQQLARWASFPAVCCQAAGGQAEWAEPLAAAWLVFYGAAYIMDTVEDGDAPDPEWAALSPAMLVNGASGLYFSASVILNELKKQPHLQGKADELVEEFYLGFLAMCAGQHRDLSTPRPTLQEFWEIAAGKSGTFFAIASRLGARLATDDVRRIQGFHDFGMQLGILVQILDDIDDLQKAASLPDWSDFYQSLAVIYALDHARPEKRARLETLLQTGGTSPGAADELLDLIDGSGAPQYLLHEYNNHHKKAVAALRQAKPGSGYEHKLLALLPSLRK